MQDKNKLIRNDIKNLIVAYLGLIFFTWHSIWSYNVFGPGNASVISGQFILSLGGLI